jgi:hypothetical protein
VESLPANFNTSGEFVEKSPLFDLAVLQKMGSDRMKKRPGSTENFRQIERSVKKCWKRENQPECFDEMSARHAASFDEGRDEF